MGDRYLMLSELNIEGQFLGFVGKKSKKPKKLRLSVPTGKVKINIPKYLRRSLVSSLFPGEQILVGGISQFNLRNNKLKLTAYHVQPVGFCPVHYQIQVQETKAEIMAKIMICQKSGCAKRGGKSFLSDIEKTLCDRGLLHKVEIEHTGCQKTCGSAPNCVVMLGQKQYTKVHPEAIASLLENHLQ
ncbi:MAG: (2Fe-2S) ferredoxin domain-containing protein [Nostocales cyanobacterium]|nr:MAG: (2Fe-2S) ferredoxin domain-containing protein [Nostocales cyanobacterium]TAF13284.1 MAG: (2Fe-2S) ferredoxin domain-containing protein [Nostocales cyanobacterium]